MIQYHCDTTRRRRDVCNIGHFAHDGHIYAVFVCTTCGSTWQQRLRRPRVGWSAEQLRCYTVHQNFRPLVKRQYLQHVANQTTK